MVIMGERTITIFIRLSRNKSGKSWRDALKDPDVQLERVQHCTAADTKTH